MSEGISKLEEKLLWLFVVGPRRERIVLATANLPQAESHKVMGAMIQEFIDDYLEERRRRREAGRPPVF